MKLILFLIYFIFINFYSYSLKAEDALTVKQQLDRIMQEVSDLNRAVFNKSFDKNDLNLNINQDDTEKFTSIDIRIYDLEKDIKNLTLQFEEIIFKIDDLSNYIEKIETELNLNFEDLKNNLKIIDQSSAENDTKEFTETNEENTLGKLVLSEEATETQNENEIMSEENVSIQNQELDIMSAEDQLQFALDQMMKKNYDKSKISLEKFIEKFPENQLSGSAHFWLGKIHQFESNYRKAAIVFGEGVQKFPKSIKAAEMYYELAKSLKEMGKSSEACKTLEILNKTHKGNKFIKDPENIKTTLKCNNED